ncbi:molybdopterin-guanine dinucleotide biosynthesis protein b [Lasius niger]|uniref:Molybdopterin-guanine dinucleotide biosynthesis protein b n=1 Tax=Lasius niger TaxID=67767 RepID=A0A0J7KNS1_LASNI|nr:molybdopterin-guanine dinucleotide biosynthesis protein b [Lasius niger]
MSLPLLGISAWSGTGKTTLLKQLIPLLARQNIRVGLIKHTHHKMDVDTRGKDSYELRKAGAHQTIVANSKRWALMTETPKEEAIDLRSLAARMDQRYLDLILVEGFKQEPIPKIQLFRENAGHDLADLALDPYTIAVASDIKLAELNITQLDLNNPVKISQFIQSWLRKEKT